MKYEGSNANVVSTRVVEKLGYKPFRMPNPTRLLDK